MTPRPALSARECLPRDPAESLLIGRAWIPAEDGPAVIAVLGALAIVGRFALKRYGGE